MNPEVLAYINTQRVGVIAVEMTDGSPHAATVHFAHHDDPLTFIFLTSPTYRKVEPLLQKELVRASFVIGLEEVPGGKEKTFQLDGVARLLSADEEMLKKVYFAKFPSKEGKHPDDVFFMFTPIWWRFTDWANPAGKTILTSDGKKLVKGIPVNT